MIKIKKYHQLPGFTFIEMLAVLFIVSVGLLAVFNLISQNIRVQQINKNSLIASQLAQEGIELIREVRDHNWRAGWPYDMDLNDGAQMMDYRDNVPRAISTPENARLYLYNNSYINPNGTETGPTPTIFIRVLTISHIIFNGNSALQVQSDVSWFDHGSFHHYSLQTLLFDWL